MLLEETHLLSRLIEDLRTLSLAESGYLQLHKEQVNVGELLADVTTSFGAQAEEASVSLQVDTTHFAPSPEPLPTGLSEQDKAAAGVIDADAMRLNQVLANLVGNALRHTPAGGAITLIGEPIEGGVRVIVSDTGSGIAEDDVPYIFNRFWRGDVSRSHEEEGRAARLVTCTRRSPRSDLASTRCHSAHRATTTRSPARSDAATEPWRAASALVWPVEDRDPPLPSSAVGRPARLRDAAPAGPHDAQPRARTAASRCWSTRSCS